MDSPSLRVAPVLLSHRPQTDHREQDHSLPAREEEEEEEESRPMGGMDNNVHVHVHV